MKKILGVLAIGGLFIACAGGGIYSNDDAGLTKLAQDLNATKEMTLVKSIKPTLEDTKTLFNEESDATTAQAMIDKQFSELDNMPENPIHGKESQTEILIKKGVVGTDLTEISGGFERIADKLKTGTEIYEFKYVEPGKDLGMKFSAFVYVNGSWKFFGKLYQAF